MALQPRSDGYQCQTDDGTDDTWSVTTEPAVARRHVLRAFTYLHVQDEDTGVTRLVAGPCSYTLKRNERVTLRPQPMVVVSTAHYCIVESPVLRVDGIAAFEDFGQARLRHGEREVRLHQLPFPLYPGETLACSVQPLPVVGANQALRLRAVRDTTDNEGTPRKAGDEWLFGPGTYVPRPEISVVGHVDAMVVGANQALRLRAVQDTTDNEGMQHRAGDEWLVKKKGVYIPAVGAEVVEVLELKLITLTSRQYCIVYIPLMDKPQRKIMQGPQSFFLQPGEVLEDGVRDICFLQANEGLDLVTRESFTDKTVTPAVSRSLGDRWTVRGPAAVVPPVEADVLGRRSAITLGPNEGVYVQNILTGEVRAEMGKPYLLTAEEGLWSKELPSDAERLLGEYKGETGTGTPQRDKTRVVTFWVPECWFAIVENHSDGKYRAVYGPELVALLPDEQFRVFSLPGGTPVDPYYSQSLILPELGQYLTDVITVTTENQERRALTVQMYWKVSKVSKDKPIVLTGTVPRAFCHLRLLLLKDAGKNNIRTEFDFGQVKFVDILNSDTEVLSLN